MLITEEQITGYAFCSEQLTDGELAYTADGIPEGEQRCAGHKQQKVPAIRQTVAYTFGDLNGHSSDPMDAMVNGMVQRSVEYVRFADEADIACPVCGQPRQVSDQLRPVYARVGGPRGGPDQVFADRRAAREQTQAQQAAASAAERQAAALERLADGAGSENADVAQLRSEIAALRAQIVANGDELEPEPEQRPSDVRPRAPRRRSPAT